MNRRFFKSLTLWLVPLLIARAIIPVGFMFMADADGVRLMFCPAVVQAHDAPMHADAHAGHSGQQMDMHAGHLAQHDQHSGGIQHNTSQDKAPCPFSLVASAALLDVAYVATTSSFVADEIFEFISLPVTSTGPIRTDRIRGPPQLS